MSSFVIQSYCIILGGYRMKKRNAIILICVLVLILVCGGLYYLWEYTEVFGKKVIPLKIESIVVQYTPGFSLKEAETFNQDEKKSVEVQKIPLKGEQLKDVQRVIHGIKKGKGTSEKIFHDDFEVIINDKVTVQMGEDVGYVIQGKNKTKVKIPSSCYEEVLKIVEKNNKKVITKISSDAITVKLDGAKMSIQNKDNLQYIHDALSYYPVAIDIPYAEYEEGYQAEIILSDKTLYLYKDRIGYLVQKEGEQDTSTYVVLMDDLLDLVQQIYQKSIGEEKKN